MENKSGGRADNGKQTWDKAACGVYIPTVLSRRLDYF